MIGEILTDIILGSTAVKNIIAYTDGSGNTEHAFYASIIPQGVPTPAVSFKVISIDSVDTKDDFSGIEKYRVQIDLFARNYDTLNKLDGAIRAAMNKAEGNYSVTDYDDTTITVDVGVSRHEETTEVFFDEADTYGRSTEYNIITNRTP